MIEEAAGTRMYECKKQQAQKTIEKKDAKLNELNTVLLFKNISLCWLLLNTCAWYIIQNVLTPWLIYGN